ncbi:hypothetical protein HMPREF9374_2472 [Desmospora sp. 8437]|nr:hypothetical protein HMPREF9374_2472 [Desmospora sp. 8437]
MINSPGLGWGFRPAVGRNGTGTGKQAKKVALHFFLSIPPRTLLLANILSMACLHRQQNILSNMDKFSRNLDHLMIRRWLFRIRRYKDGFSILLNMRK